MTVLTHVGMNAQVRERLVNLNKAKCKWTQLVDDALDMQDNLRNMNDRQQQEWRFVSDLHKEFEYVWLEELRSRCMFIWRVFLKPPLLKVQRSILCHLPSTASLLRR